MKPFTIALLFVGVSFVVIANEPLWTEQERLQNRDVVLTGVVISSEKVAGIDGQTDLHIAVIEVDGMKKGKKTAKGSRVNVYYEFSASGGNDRCPRYAELKKGDKGMFFLLTLSDEIKTSLRIETVKNPAFYLHMGSDFEKLTAEPDNPANATPPRR